MSRSRRLKLRHFLRRHGVAVLGVFLLHFSIVRRACPTTFLRSANGRGWFVERPIHH